MAARKNAKPKIIHKSKVELANVVITYCGANVHPQSSSLKKATCKSCLKNYRQTKKFF